RKRHTINERNQFIPCIYCEMISRSEEHTSELQSLTNIVCRLLLEKKRSKLPARQHPIKTGTRWSLLRSDCIPHVPSLPFFFFNDTATTEIYTLSLHDALPISVPLGSFGAHRFPGRGVNGCSLRRSASLCRLDRAVRGNPVAVPVALHRHQTAFSKRVKS